MMTEKEAKQDLAILHYSGKWKRARELVRLESKHRHNYWATVRRTYLELGGEFIIQLQPWQRIQYWTNFNWLN